MRARGKGSQAKEEDVFVLIPNCVLIPLVAHNSDLDLVPNS